MSNKVEQFLNANFGEVRATKDDKGVIWFVAKDIAKVLKYITTQKVTDKVHDESIIKLSKSQLPNLGNWGQTGGKDVVLINESGLYQVVFSITKKDTERYNLSKDFNLWITNEVIPTIRQTGAYIEENREQEVVDKYFYGLSDELKLQVFKELQNNNEKLKVKAGKFDKFLSTDSSYTFTEVAKLLSTKAKEDYGSDLTIGRNKLTEYLRNKGVLSKTKTSKSYTNLPNQKYESYFDVVVRDVNSEINKAQCRVKSNGVEFIYDMLILDEFQLEA